jgi:hypothetical protein
LGATIPLIVQRLLKKNAEPHIGARPSVRLCVGPELAHCVNESNGHGVREPGTPLLKNE